MATNNNIKLTHVITIDGAEVYELTVKRDMNLGDAEAIEGLGKTASLVVLASRLCGISEDVIRTINKDDFEVVDKGIAPFCEPVKSSRKTGGKSESS